MAEHRSLGTVIGRALRLRCPCCGGGRLFRGWFRMHENCPDCGLKYERAPGYFLGSAYINYAITAVALTVLYVGLHFGAELSNRTLAAPLAIFCVVLPLFLFRYARSLWLAIDSYIDTTGFERQEE